MNQLKFYIAFTPGNGSVSTQVLTISAALKLSISVCLLCFVLLNPVRAQGTHKVDWARFLSRHDLKWNRLSTDFYSGAFIGNGELGAVVYQENEHSLRWDIGRSDVTDHREYHDVEWGKARLPIGRMLLKAEGRILKSTMQLDLWNAEARGIITTDKGSISWRSFVSNNPDAIVTTLTETGSEKVEWEFVPEVAKSPRLGLYAHEKGPNHYTKSLRSDYPPNPPFRKESYKEIHTVQ